MKNLGNDAVAALEPLLQALEDSAHTMEIIAAHVPTSSSGQACARSAKLARKAINSIRARGSAPSGPTDTERESLDLLRRYVRELDKWPIPDACPIGTNPEGPAGSRPNVGDLRIAIRAIDAAMARSTADDKQADSAGPRERKP